MIFRLFGAVRRAELNETADYYEQLLKATNDNLMRAVTESAEWQKKYTTLRNGLVEYMKSGKYEDLHFAITGKKPADKKAGKKPAAKTAKGRRKKTA